MVTFGFGGWMGGGVNILKGALALNEGGAHVQIGVVGTLLQGVWFAGEWSR